MAAIKLPREVKGIKIGIIGSGVDMLDIKEEHCCQWGSFYTGMIDSVPVLAVPRHGIGEKIALPHEIRYEDYMRFFAETRYLVSLTRVGDLTGEFKAGTTVIPEDFVTLNQRPVTLRLPGAEFANCNTLVDDRLVNHIQDAADKTGQDVYIGGVYNTHHGPQFETPADAGLLQWQGASLAGMTAGYEAVLAAELRQYNKSRHRAACPHYACICTVVNPASNHSAKVSHAVTEREMAKAKPKLEKLVRALVHELAQYL